MAQITNQAKLSYNGTVVNSNVAVGEIVQVLTATKTAVPDVYAQGATVVYAISIVNSGAAPVTGVTLSDDLGGYPFGETTLYPLTYTEGSVKVFENGTLLTDPVTVTPGAPLEISGLTVPAGGNVTVLYAATVNSFAPAEAGNTINNTVTVDGTGITPFDASAVINAQTEPSLTITKSISPETVTENGTVTYAFLIQNFGAGAADASANVTVTDTLDPVLTSLTAVLDGEPMERTTTYTYSEETGSFETVAGAITVPAATFTQDAQSGEWTVSPGSTTLTITGTVA